MCYREGGEKERRERTRERAREGRGEKEGRERMREREREGEREREREREENSNINFCLFCRLDERYSTVITPSSPQVLHIDYNKLSNATICVFPMLVSICAFPMLVSKTIIRIYLFILNLSYACRFSISICQLVSMK